MIQHRSQLVGLLRDMELPLVAVEVGVAEGLFSRDLLADGMDKLYSVDNWGTLDQTGDGGSPQSWHDKNYEETQERLATFGNKSIILKGISFKVAALIPDNTCGLVYLDGDHSYEGVKKDIQYYWPKLVDGGILAGHDYLNPSYGVRQAVEEFAFENNYVIHVIPENKEVDAGFFLIK